MTSDLWLSFSTNNQCLHQFQYRRYLKNIEFYYDRNKNYTIN